MSEPSSASARRIVDQVASLADGQREAAIERACAGDSVLRAQVDALLRPRSAPGMDAPTLDIDAGATDGRADGAALIEGPGARIGPYKILELIGEGGFGSVFLAEQEKPVRRMVALKIIKLGMDTRQVVARFEQERQALAMMDHPNIARVLDAGATGAGRPFFVMELVRGEPITGYCDKQNIDIRGRLRLFTQVCNAVQHAHTKGVIHRDIKPSNVLVSLVDGAPSVKVIDFGIAKATSARLTDRTVYTEQRSMVGTPEYMSPEQAEGSLDIDTRTDVYSLGVLLYELLTGTTPFESDQLRSGMQAEVQRIIREVDPLRPSARLARESGTRAAAAERRRISPASLTSLLKGELDWIAMKAMEKDRTRRYETARGLGLDVERFLEGQPVSAAPPGAAYQIGKFVKRNRVGVVAGGLVALALVLGVAGTTVGLVRATAQRRIAEANAQEAAAQAQRASDAEREATVRLQESEATVEFLDDMLGAADPTTKGKDVTVRAILDEAGGRTWA
jgi:serine/threonine protein kinase